MKIEVFGEMSPAPSQSEEFVLLALNGFPMSSRELQNELSLTGVEVSMPSLTSAIGRLRKKGYIEPSDPRDSDVEVSERGVEALRVMEVNRKLLSGTYYEIRDGISCNLPPTRESVARMEAMEKSEKINYFPLWLPVAGVLLCYFMAVLVVIYICGRFNGYWE